MKLKKYLTKFIFYLFDFLKNKSITKEFEKVKTANESVFDNHELVDYLHKWNRDTDICKNPLITKVNLKEIISKINKKNIYSWAYTGGSSGEPFKIPYSLNRNYTRTATFKYFNEIGGYDLGDPFLLIRAKDKSKLVKYLRNEYIHIPGNISKNVMESLYELIMNNNIKVLIGYPNVIYELALVANEKTESKINYQLKSIISVSEPIDADKRDFIFKTFNCNFIDRYSIEEVGLIAQQEKFGGEYIVNSYGVYTELLDDDTFLPVKEGQVGRVVVTDVKNDLIPMIRYDTGDYAIAKKYKNDMLFSIDKIVGRSIEKIFSDIGEPISPLILGPYIYKPLSNMPFPVQYQFVQKSKLDYILKLKIKHNKVPQHIIDSIGKNISNILGKKANFKIEYVENIEVQNSGKLALFKNEYLTNG